MKMKKLVSAIAALAMSVSSFAAFAAEGDVTTNASANFDDGTWGDVVLGSQWTPNSSISDDGWFMVGNTADAVLTIPDEQLAGPTDVVTIKFKVAYGRLSKKNFWYKISDSNGTEFVNWTFRAYDGTISSNVLGNGSDLPTTGEFYYANNTPLTDRAADLTFTIDFANGTVTQTTVNLQNNATTTHTNPLPAGVTNVKKLAIGSNYNNSERRCAVDDILITTTEGAAAETAAYKVNYVLGDEVIKSVDGEGVVGNDPIVAMNEFWNDDSTTKYFCVSNDLGDQTIAADGSLVVTVTVREADTYTGNIVASTGEVISSYSVFEGESTSYSNSMYLTDANNKVTAKADSNSFTTTITPTESADITVPYTEFDGVAYFAEGEALNNNSALASANYSGGSAQRATNYGDTAFTVAEAGTYKITVAGSCRNTNNNSVFSVYKNVAFTTSTETAEDGTETTVYTEVAENLLFNGDFKGTSQNTVQSQGTISTTEDVVLAAGDVIILAGDNGQSWIDYILVERTGDVPVEASIDSAVAVVATYPESEEYEGTATALTATFTITGDASFNYVTFAVGAGSAEGAVTTVSGNGASAVYGIVVNALVEAADVTATASMTE